LSCYWDRLFGCETTAFQMANEDNQVSDIHITEGSIYDVTHASDLKTAQAEYGNPG